METKKQRRKVCCVPGCRLSNRHLAQEGEKFFHFTRVPAMAQKWVRAVNNPNLVVEEAHMYHRNKCVCHRHFATSQYNTPERLHLNRNAVPTLFLPSSDSTEDGLSESDPYSKIAESGVQDERESREDGVKEATGNLEEAGSQFVSHLDNGYRNERDLEPLHKDQDRVEVPVQEDTQLRQDILTENDRAQHHNSNGMQTNHQSHCREPETHVGGTAVNERDITETCHITSDHGDTDECRDVKFIPNEPCTVAVDSWENLPNQLCRLCASTDEHPKQSIVGWLGMLNEIIPDLVALNDGLPQHICRPCTNKLYTCNKIKADFVEAYNKLEECLGFTKSPGIQFVVTASADYDDQTFDEVAEEEMVCKNEDLVSEVEEQLASEVEEPLETEDEVQLVSEVEEHLVTEDEVQLVTEFEDQLVSEAEGPFEVPSEDLHRVTPMCENNFLEGTEMTLNAGDDLSVNPEEFPISATDDGTTLQGSFPQGESECVADNSGMCDIMKGQRVQKYKYVCGECEEIFTKKVALNAHRLSHAPVSECEFCSKKFTSTSQLDDHRRIHTKELPFMCEVCGKCFRNMTRLRHHEFVHKPPSYTCPVCNNKFRSRMYLRQHKRVHSADTKLICELCGKMLYTVSSLQIHLRIHTGEKPFQCDVCGKCFISAGRLKHHGFNHSDSKFQCDTCGKEFIFKKTLIQHQECHVKLKECRCPICLREFSNLQNTKRHRKISCKKPVCIVCGETFLTDEMVEEHRTKEHTEDEVAFAAKGYSRQKYFKSCPVCAKSIYSVRDMLKHMKEHHSDYDYKPFACELCTKTFSTASALRTHRIWHSEHRSFPCVTCGKRFKTKYTLKWHDLSVHKNEHPFHCPFCDRQFKRLSDLIVHKRKHTGERPFPCPICMQKFFTKSDMLKHAMKHSQSSVNVAWKEVVEGTVPISEIVFPSQDLSCDVNVVECVD
ncbi:hypothetical protein B7P43_G02525 [Cryptotermes secundus]|uniref:Uncharacterized protein n=1 Tax=Cryptotermes secundus TaxID=105785 RepID=A0A2J7Q2I7_9NEOP|nr:hypothetical protein B7P43_G02525 [Cryptotermes secundus]